MEFRKMRKIKKCRLLAGYTQNDVALKLGVHPSSITHWEHGDNMPKASRLKEVAKLYECSIEDLME